MTKATLTIAAAAMLACGPAISAAAANRPKAASRTFEAEMADLSGGAGMLRDATASGEQLAAVSGPGQSIRFNRVPASGTCAIR
jgi:hypothetical protein